MSVELEMNEYGQPVGSPVPSWEAAKLPDGSSLVGRFCKLVPMDIDVHGEQLYDAFCNPIEEKDWTYLPPQPFTCKEEFISYYEKMSSTSDPYQFVIVDLNTGLAVGSIALMRIDSANGVIEIGHVTFSKKLKKTAMATETIYLLMKYVFEDLGYRRLEWKCHTLNAPSWKSATRFGFTFEGIFRQAAVVKGRNRDTAWFSLLDYEFEKIRNGFVQWLDDSNFDSCGQQLHKLSELIQISAD